MAAELGLDAAGGGGGGGGGGSLEELAKRVVETGRALEAARGVWERLKDGARNAANDKLKQVTEQSKVRLIARARRRPPPPPPPLLFV